MRTRFAWLSMALVFLAGLAFALTTGAGSGGGDSGTVVVRSPQAAMAPATGTGSPIPGATLRVVPISANEAFVIAPHPVLGAIALHLLKGNGADDTLPAASVGAPYGSWRIHGFRMLPSVDADPALGTVIHRGIGSAQYAVQMGANVGTYAGIYHGGETELTETGDQPIAAGYVASFTLRHRTVLAWPGGQTIPVEETVTLTDDGAIETHTTIQGGTHDLYQAYFDMTMASKNFRQVVADGTTLDVSAPGEYNLLGGPATVSLRDPDSGLVMTVTDDAPAQPHFVRKFILSKTDQVKLYPLFDPPRTGLGTVTVNRRITFGRMPADLSNSFGWSGAQDGAFGFTVMGDGAGYDPVTRQVILRQGVGGPYFNRAIWRISGLTPGQAYSVPVDLETSGSSTGGATIGISVNANGGSAQAVAPAAVAAGQRSYAFTAAASTVYLTFTQMYQADSAKVLRINRVGPMAVNLFRWSGAEQGGSGYRVIGNGVTFDAASSQLVMTQSLGAPHFNRVIWTMNGLTPGVSYSLPVTLQTTGTSLSGATTLRLSANPDGSAGQDLSPALRSGTTGYRFTATAATMYVALNQMYAPDTQNSVRVTSLGPLGP